MYKKQFIRHVNSCAWGVVLSCLMLSVTQAQNDLPEGHPPLGGAPSQDNVVHAGLLYGPVLETTNAQGYTYLHVQTEEGPVWVATTQIPAATGDIAAFMPGMMMKDFHSPTLERTFDFIRFVGHVEIMPSTEAGGKAPEAAPSAQAAADPVLPYAQEVSVAEILRDVNGYVDQHVAVHGRVTKFTPSILGRNWIHIEGEGAEGGDLTITTSAPAQIGDIIRAIGILRTDQDFGAGYTYDALLEEAVIEVVTP